MTGAALARKAKRVAAYAVERATEQVAARERWYGEEPCAYRAAALADARGELERASAAAAGCGVRLPRSA